MRVVVGVAGADDERVRPLGGQEVIEFGVEARRTGQDLAGAFEPQRVLVAERDDLDGVAAGLNELLAPGPEPAMARADQRHAALACIHRLPLLEDRRALHLSPLAGRGLPKAASLRSGRG